MSHVSVLLEHCKASLLLHCLLGNVSERLLRNHAGEPRGSTRTLLGDRQACVVCYSTESNGLASVAAGSAQVVCVQPP